MDVIGLPFPFRVLLLAGIFAVLALVNSHRDRSRWKEYAFVFVAGGTAGTLGVFNDLITSAISPAYFEIAKGIPRGEGFGLRVASLGFQAGFIAGALVACAYLYANNPRPGRPRVRYRVLCRLMVVPLLAAVGLASIAGAGSTFARPGPFVRQLSFLVPVPEAGSFLAVAAIHAGLYVGLVIGVVVSIRSLRRQRAAGVDAIADNVPAGDGGGLAPVVGSPSIVAGCRFAAPPDPRRQDAT